MSSTSVDELVPIVVDSQNSTLEYSGDWNLISDSRIPSKAAPNPYRQTTDSAASVSLNFTGTAVAIHSPVNWGHWTYNVVCHMRFTCSWFDLILFRAWMVYRGRIIPARIGLSAILSCSGRVG